MHSVPITLLLGLFLQMAHSFHYSVLFFKYFDLAPIDFLETFFIRIIFAILSYERPFFRNEISHLIVQQRMALD